MKTETQLQYLAYPEGYEHHNLQPGAIFREGQFSFEKIEKIRNYYGDHVTPGNLPRFVLLSRDEVVAQVKTSWKERNIGALLNLRSDRDLNLPHSTYGIDGRLAYGVKSQTQIISGIWDVTFNYHKTLDLAERDPVYGRYRILYSEEDGVLDVDDRRPVDTDQYELNILIERLAQL